MGNGTGPKEYQRELGACQGAWSGPTLLLIGGIHGNEPAGVSAIRQFLRSLGSSGFLRRGAVVGYAGNIPALRQGVRYQEYDMNRCWTPTHLNKLPTDTEISSAEGRESRQLQASLEQVLTQESSAYVIDLHTTTAESIPFCCFADSLKNITLAKALPIPSIYGLVEHLHGSLVEYMTRRGFPAMAIEGGQHRDTTAVDLLESCLWILADSLNMLQSDAQPAVNAHKDILRKITGMSPGKIEVVYRHEVRNTGEFLMKPGYKNFQKIQKNELLAHDAAGPIHAPKEGRILLPLYQGLGDDGFFLGRILNELIRRVIVFIRRLRLENWLEQLPTISRMDESGDTYVLRSPRPSIRRLWLFRQLGFRRVYKTAEGYILKRLRR